MEAEPQDWFGAWIKPPTAGRVELRGGRASATSGVDLLATSRSGSRPASTSSSTLPTARRIAAGRAELAGDLQVRPPRADRARGQARRRHPGRDPRIQLATRDATMGLMRRTADLSHATIAGPVPPLGRARDCRLFGLVRDVPAVRGCGAAAQRHASSLARAPPPGDRGDGLHGASTCRRYTRSGSPIARGRTTSTESVAGRPREPLGDRVGVRVVTPPSTRTSAPSTDFDEFVAAAQAAGLEVALDYALQCSPDHPWVTEHPEWFRHRSDGSIRYAENPPKQYQDIYPIDFDSDDAAGLWSRVRRRHALLDRPRRAHLPGRQPAHQAVRASGSG